MTPTPIVALDVPTTRAALALADRLGDGCAFYKVGLELFTAEGPRAVAALRDRGADVFLDLKLHDIPNTVAGAARSAARLGVRLLTVHASGGSPMVRAAVQAAGEECGILAVTLLTSLDPSTAAAAWGRDALDVADEVVRLAGVAAEAGALGVVCSGHEAARVRDVHGSALATLVPGVRPASAPAHDQARVVTPAAAAAAGARWVVLGRAVTAAADPAAALAALRAELGAAPNGPAAGPRA
ncbi:MAG TPA: orotidine-5'-phosphate decarboxylase [Gemmatirosa sp.]|nr:orotidine-5'-phosphate decarboxylase [Gemmatirosa sp.]